ncbi:class I SAM-dependent methyltransferase [bacterium 210820-DFI.6.37]|nr:class I SAM-dependent methyltransferase [bacterium 210820-DFI.6.37]
MKNPWEEIPLNDYENHMKLASVMQLQAMNEMMKAQFEAYPVSSVMIFGIAGGNGLEHISKHKFKKVYGIDVNSSYLKEVRIRYPNLEGTLECLCLNLIHEADQLPKADLVIANLLIEYIGYECFQKAIQYAAPKYVSCVIQINMEGNWVSDSPYLDVFQGLERVHYQMEERALGKAMDEIDYHTIRRLERELPNGKKLVQMDFERSFPSAGEV